MKKFGLMALFAAAGALLPRLTVISTVRGKQAAELAVEEARRLAEARTNEIIILKNLAEILNQTLPPSKALEAGLEMVARRYAAASAWLLTLTPDQKAELSAGFQLPPGLDLARKREQPWALCNCLKEAMSGQLHAIHKFQCERLARAPGIPPDQKHHLSIPVRASGVVVGILNLVIPSERVFTGAEMHLLAALGDQFGGAVERARLFKEVHQLAITDSLTRLFNRRHFFEVAAKELERSRRYRHSLTLVMIDIDYFKTINDQYGHLAGDQALLEVAQLCQHMMRRIDTIGRFGGEEIVILMPETDEEHAIQAVERLRRRVEQLQVSTPRGTISVTISAGIAHYTGRDFMSLEMLIDRADQALYQSKHNGRNQVRAFQKVRDVL